MGDKKLGFILLFIHIISSLIVGFLFRFWKPIRIKNFTPITSKNEYNSKNIGNILIDSISKSINTILNIGGFIVLFSVIISILDNSQILTLLSIPFKFLGIPSQISSSLISGILELTNGIKKISIIGISNLRILITLISFILGFGGISVMLQIYSIISNCDLSIKPYIFGKILNSIISAIITYLLIKI